MGDTTTYVTENSDTEQSFGFPVFSGRQIQDSQTTRKEFLIDGIITPGLNLLAAPRKIGKSWMALDIALCVAGKNNFLDRKTEHGKVLYFALEDNVDRIKERMNVLLDDADAPEGIQFSFSIGGTNGKASKSIDNYLDKVPDCKLIIIDVLQMIRTDKNTNQTDYSHDYGEVGALKKIADSHGISILVVHHTRKTKDSSNPLNEIYGGVGVASVVDTIIMIRSEGDTSKKQAKLFVTGRDLQEQRLAIAFDTDQCRWKYVGTEEELNIKKDKDAYAKSLPIKAVKLLMKNNNSWQGTTTELMDVAKRIIGGLGTMSASAFARKINKFDNFLLEDGIKHIKPDPNGGVNGRKHIFIKEGTAQNLPATSRQDAPYDDMYSERPWPDIPDDSGYMEQPCPENTFDGQDAMTDDMYDAIYIQQLLANIPDDPEYIERTEIPSDSGYMEQPCPVNIFDEQDIPDDIYDALEKQEAMSEIYAEMLLKHNKKQN